MPDRMLAAGLGRDLDTAHTAAHWHHYLITARHIARQPCQCGGLSLGEVSNECNPIKHNKNKAHGRELGIGMVGLTIAREWDYNGLAEYNYSQYLICCGDYVWTVASVGVTGPGARCGAGCPPLAPSLAVSLAGNWSRRPAPCCPHTCHPAQPSPAQPGESRL